jgi:hypothetical protein
MPVQNAGPGATATKAAPRKTTARRPTPSRTAAEQSASRGAGASEAAGASAGRSAEARAAAGRGRIERTSEFSAQMLEQVAVARVSALEAVRGFMESLDRALPLNGDGPSRPQVVIDSALSMSQRMVKAQHDLACGVVRGAGKVLSRPENAK